jgi:hypothetical protein
MVDKHSFLLKEKMMCTRVAGEMINITVKVLILAKMERDI